MSTQHHKKRDSTSPFFYGGGEGGIRTLDTRLTYTPLAGERLQPLGHFSGSAKPTTKTSAKKRRFTLRHKKILKIYHRLLILAFEQALVCAL